MVHYYDGFFLPKIALFLLLFSSNRDKINKILRILQDFRLSYRTIRKRAYYKMDANSQFMTMYQATKYI